MGSGASSDGGDDSWKNAKSVYDFTVKDIKGEDVSLEKYRGHPLIIVNVASDCGYTAKNYKDLNELDEKYRESKGLRILAFPCNQFGGQEPGDSEKICTRIEKRGVKFDVFEKIDVNGKNAHPLYNYLKAKQPGTLINAIKWNFGKFIIDKEGQPVGRFGSGDYSPTYLPELEKIW